ncbi:MAG: ACT domain-containing protein, partial [Solirubrobacteraceae bacterium]
GPFNAVTVESHAITELTLSGPGAGGRQIASAVLGDVVSVMTGGARPPAPPLALRLLEDVSSAFYLHLEVADRPGVLAAVTRVLGEQGVSIKSVLQRGLAEHARLVMVTHQVAESRLRAAVALLGASEFIRSTPRMIRVIEEEFL